MISPRRRARESALKALYQAEIANTENNEALNEVLSETLCRAIVESVVKDFLKSSKSQDILSGKVEDFLPTLTDSLSVYPHGNLEEIPSKIKEILEKFFPGVTYDPNSTKDIEELCEKMQAKISKLNKIEEFAQQLINKISDHISIINETIEKTAENWTLDRIANIDRCILKIAICELFYFPEIPINVTINEAIELAKKYSDDRSYEFINGILDKVSKENKIEKLPDSRPVKTDRAE